MNYSIAEVASRTQTLRSRPRTLTLKKSDAKDRVAEDSWLPRGQGQKRTKNFRILSDLGL